MTIPIDDLIHIADGQMGYFVNVTHEAYNTGITMIESLKDACLPEMYEFDSVKMHDVVQDVGKDMEKLTKFRDAIKEKVDGAEREGYKPKPDVLKWLKATQPFVHRMRWWKAGRGN
uniref:NBS-coding resistance protein n=1 Tax=Solanum tuberosum TaxID=4113 RepID=M1CXT4_SOLTU